MQRLGMLAFMHVLLTAFVSVGGYIRYKIAFKKGECAQRMSPDHATVCVEEQGLKNVDWSWPSFCLQNLAPKLVRGRRWTVNGSSP